MTPKIATTLSIVGVLAAGSAAAAVNTNILDSGPNESTASAAVAPLAGSVDMSVPEPGATSVATTTVPSSTTTMATTPSLADPATAPTITTFNVGDAGAVTVELADAQLRLVSVVPADGWVVATEEPNDDNGQGGDGQGGDAQDDQAGELDDAVQVAFESTTVRVEFGAQVVDGKIVPSVESKSLVRQAATSDVLTTAAPAPAPGVPVTAAPAPSMPGTTAGHDDDHGDDHDQEDHGDDAPESGHVEPHDNSGSGSGGEPRERDDD